MTMDVDSRSIDLAKTASIDMMGLNNKVVNMRQVVRRTKVQVINKLCRHIAALKKKKGTEQQKSKNLSKAERFLEEIESIKKLKEDKVSKYALANTRTFSDVCKESLSSGPRALGRLADHPLMKKVVSDFREQHSDWQDLAAYLLIKQTGRRFKTKKQKQKKLSKCVENMNAAETMTKAYIQERFGKEGLQKAEIKFERKNKKLTRKTAEDTESDKPEHKTVVNTLTKLEESKSESNQKSLGDSTNLSDNDDGSKLTNINTTDSLLETCSKSELDTLNKLPKSKMNSKEISSSDTIDEVCDKKNNKEKINNSKMKLKLSEEDITNYDSDSSDSDSNYSEAINSDDAETDSELENKDAEFVKKSIACEDTEKESKENMRQKKSKECVVKELNLSEEESSNSEILIADDNTSSEDEDFSDANDDSGEEVSEDDSSSGDDKTDDDGASSLNDDDEETEDDKSSNSASEGNAKIIKKTVKSGSSKKNEGKKMKKEKQIPEFLLKAQSKPVNDPFFGSGDEDDSMAIRLEDNQLLNDNDIGNDDLSYDRFKIGSMFYNPEIKSSEKSARQGKFAKRGGHTKFGGERRSGPLKQNTSKKGDFKQGSFKEHSAGEKRFDKSKHSSRESSATISRDKNSINNTRKDSDPKKVNIKSEKLHPSWEASRKRKAEQSGIAEFKGKKITFNDDD
ncbi:serum response factor-binding protein 1-like [Biomphalaria glabrata]|uniref:Serum response factor-binding protein 1-like n=1 Tax=Biomphalaria glabrata TaxID=6526 RepID=A0A9U8EM88_BIOGL|nr:serum response factor-binding protein 1-like [Biomphalaria glabrata]